MPRWLGPALVAVLALVAHAFGPWWSHPATASAPPRGDGVRVATWNLRNFPGPDQDLDRLADALADLDADILMLQEIHDVDRLAALLPDHRVAASRGSGSHGQHVAIAWNPSRVELEGELHEHDALTLGGRVRPAVSARFFTPSGPLVVFGVHLKAGADGLPLRHLQWISLAAAVALRSPRDPIVVIGDFNAAGGRTMDPAVELGRLDAILGSAGLHRVPEVGQCTAFWEGVRRDGWWVPSRLDLAFASGDLEVQGPAWIGGACARHGCDPVHSTDAHPDPDLGRVTDHCPVVIDLRP